MGVITTQTGKCKRCYTCIRNCPVKALTVEKGEAKILEEKCVSCGTCYKVCTQKAKNVENHCSIIRELLDSGANLTALVAPSFPASFYSINPKQTIHAIRELGFSKIVEVAYGAELVGRECKRMMESGEIHKPVIASPCPVVVSLIQKHYPKLIPHLAPVVSPLIAIGRYLRDIEKDDSIKVFIGPCIGKKEEIKDPAVEGIIDYVLTFRELKEMFRNSNIEPHTLTGTPFDPPVPGTGRIFPLMGGILKTGGFGTEILDPSIAIIEGRDSVMEFLNNFERHPPEQEFIDILYCDGCINGVEIDSPLSSLEKHKKVAKLVSETRHLNPSSLPEVDLVREYHDQKLLLHEPTDAELAEILRQMGKICPEDELNCGACGYMTCRNKARAVFHGFAEIEMCMPQLIRQLELSIAELKKSHEQLKLTQAELLQSEKLASLGQLSAGVAHELNNPLGGILLFANILQEAESKCNGDNIPEELKIIVKEATRCRNIVKGLLDFARQSKIQRTRVDINQIISDVVTMESRNTPENIKIVENVCSNCPQLSVDTVQIRQVFSNIVRNAVQAMPDGGVITISTQHRAETGKMVISVRDTGTGISEEHLSKLFTPFFTTKGTGKGTGLGLAICYGIIKMHRGAIEVESTPGEGTTFKILLPVESDDDFSRAI
ncbi:MAG: histidine kinase [Candidatus Wallbacteria bacterium HGW-Wallbacteria-1]|jgi:signal transduction histidine kinase/Fe-S-cluster-containing hydrogenase component 2|uniref:histidine kinase n=1 Tax=Candidatus Wallbacteria bacterium HGW-Wallbacteria-1 TaxID=2013854 RepID=A0A2N1PRF7_9BACT|nr:MAG: histidine kinase [Candidatus Wallbacteria bacterium HGW-Wallbacteria-1]